MLMLWVGRSSCEVLLDIDKPLRRGVKIATGKETSKWVEIKYERLGDFCFYCGRLGHTNRACQFHGDGEESGTTVVYQYGPWWKAAPRRRSRQSFTEREKGRKP